MKYSHHTHNRQTVLELSLKYADILTAEGDYNELFKLYAIDLSVIGVNG